MVCPKAYKDAASCNRIVMDEKEDLELHKLGIIPPYQGVEYD